MMKNKLTKPASFLLYFLSTIIFFFAGMFFVRFSGLAEGQGLAGGAIVFNYGLFFAIFALAAAIYTAYAASPKVVVLINRILLLCLIILIASFTYLLMS